MRAQRTLHRRISDAMFKSQCGNIEWHKCSTLAGIAIRYYARHINKMRQSALAKDSAPKRVPHCTP